MSNLFFTVVTKEEEVTKVINHLYKNGHKYSYSKERCIRELKDKLKPYPRTVIAVDGARIMMGHLRSDEDFNIKTHGYGFVRNDKLFNNYVLDKKALAKKIAIGVGLVAMPGGLVVGTGILLYKKLRG